MCVCVCVFLYIHCIYYIYVDSKNMQEYAMRSAEICCRVVKQQSQQ